MNTCFSSVNGSMDDSDEMPGMHDRVNEKKFDYSEIESAMHANKSGKATGVDDTIA